MEIYRNAFKPSLEGMKEGDDWGEISGVVDEEEWTKEAVELILPSPEFCGSREMIWRLIRSFDVATTNPLTQAFFSLFMSDASQNFILSYIKERRYPFDHYTPLDFLCKSKFIAFSEASGRK